MTELVKWLPQNEYDNEGVKVRWNLVKYTRGRGLDIGSGPQKAFAHFISLAPESCNINGHDIPPDVKAPYADLSMFTSRSMDFVFSAFQLDRQKDWNAALKEWWRVVKIGGYLILYMPHPCRYPLVKSEVRDQRHLHDIMPQELVDTMKTVGSWSLMSSEEVGYGYFHVYRRDAEKGHRDLSSKHENEINVVRYGAFGDLMQTSSVVAALKAAGKYVVLHTSVNGGEVIKHDPNIDELVINDTDQVPNASLGEYWTWMRERAPLVNLSETVEGVFLALPGRSNHMWPHEVRRRYMDVNYLEFAHQIAGVPGPYVQTFYPTLEEKAWARKQRDRMGKFVVMWSLVGSSVHKRWPHLDVVIARLMLAYDDVHVVLVGGPEGKILEQGWEAEKRVRCTSGEWGIRESLAFTQVADLIIGPETGVLNAAANIPAPKIITLSHSSKENLTKHWDNTTSLRPEATPCYPCHRLHYGWEHCVQNEKTSCAQCQTDITADMMWDAVVAAIPAKLRNEQWRPPVTTS